MTETMYFEDIEVGHVEEFGDYAVTAEEIIEFARQYDPQPFHLSEEAGRAMIFGGLCASGWHTCSMAMRMLVDAMPSPSASIGSPGVDELRWLKPVFPGDRLRVKSSILGKHRSISRPEMGTVFCHNEVINQHDEVVLSFRPIVLYRLRSPQ